ncbi:glutamate receptor ionotropic, delta-2-like [Bacillus rossius redtenbacheri]|uniref:glutamate receptor ionotropic, delta-2-like n=1 Tax=Bacillus rossius redtenbacheri TaxID=93214 RepID=UPI002FDDDE9B
MAARLLLLVALLGPACCVQPDLLEFLQAVLRPPVVVLTCWSIRESVELVKALSQAGLMTSVQDCHGHIPAATPFQPVTFLLDLQSEQAAGVMSSEVLRSNRVADTPAQEGAGARDTSLPMFSSMKVFVDSQVTLVHRRGQGSFSLTEVYRLGPDQTAVFTATGQWQRGSGLLGWPARRTNLHRTTLRAAMVVTENETLDHLTDLHNIHVDTVTKLNYILLLHIGDLMNASMELSIVDTWGYPSNGSWSGMVGSLQREEADIGATALFFTANRLPVIDYIAMTTPTKVAFVFRQPPMSFVANVFLMPFSQGVWLCSAGLVAVCTTALYCALTRESRQDASSRAVSWSDVLLLSLGAVCQQGSQVQPRGTSGRIVTIVLFVAVLFLYTSYSGCIVALLQSSTDSIRTLQDLLNSRLELGAHDIVYNRYYFETASDPVRAGLARKVLAPGPGRHNLLELEPGVERLRLGFFAFHMEVCSGYKVIKETFTEEEKCGLQSIGGYIQPDTNAWIAVRRGSPYAEILKRGYRKVHEHGLQNRELVRLYTRKPECTGHASSFVSVGLVDWYPALLVLLAGAVASLLVLLMESAVHRRLLHSHTVSSVTMACD